jgi:hypothetical protein
MKKRYSDSDIRDALTRGRPAELSRLIITIALYHEDFDFAFKSCLKLARHADSNVRGNAILGFGHLARRFGRLPLRRRVKSIIEEGIKEPGFDVSGQAWAAASDVSHFLSWKIKGFRRKR